MFVRMQNLPQFSSNPFQASKLPELPNQKDFSGLEKMTQRQSTGAPDAATVEQNKYVQAQSSCFMMKCTARALNTCPKES